MQDSDIEAKLSKEYNEMKREHEAKMDGWRKQQKLKIKELTKELRLQLEAANVDLHRELEEFVSKDSQLKAVEGEAGAAFYKAQSDYDRVLAEFKAVEVREILFPGEISAVLGCSRVRHGAVLREKREREGDVCVCPTRQTLPALSAPPERRLGFTAFKHTT
jgi:hypothetical protein